MNYRIFLVEDDRSIADGLRNQLEQSGRLLRPFRF